MIGLVGILSLLAFISLLRLYVNRLMAIRTVSALDSQENQAGIVQLENEFCKGSNEKDDFALAVQPVELLNAAPLSVNILGTLCLIATGPDFSLKVKDLKFDLLRCPESFRASLCQISNEGYFAFLEADTQMNKIRMLTNEIPEKLKS